MDSSLEGHFNRIKGRLENGRRILEQIYNSKHIEPYEIPNVKPETDVFNRPPPLRGDS